MKVLELFSGTGSVGKCCKLETHGKPVSQHDAYRIPDDLIYSLFLD